ncbi:MAG: hypothetical protein ACI4ET_06635 [Bilifractor sp.]
MMNTLWIKKKDGNLYFPGRHQMTSAKKKPESGWYHPITLTVIIFVCCAVDLFNFKGLFDSFMFDNLFARIIGITAFLIAYDIIPVYLGSELKKKTQGFNVNTPMLIIMLAIFIMAFVINCMLRYATRNLVLPDMTQMFGSVSTQNAETQVSFFNDLPLVNCVFSSIVPLITSLASGTISFAMADPLKGELLRLEEERNVMNDRISELTSIITEYQSYKNYKEYLETLDEKEYQTAREQIEAQRKLLQDHVRTRLAEASANPASSNLLLDPNKADIKKAFHQVA